MTTIVHRNHVRVSGAADGQPMLFAHGFGCDQSMWRFVTAPFEPSRRVVLFDYVGAGGSDPGAYTPERYATLDGYVEDVLDICGELDLRDVIFVGHSVSAMIGVLAARRAPERFAKLVLVGPSPRYIDDGDYVGGFNEAEITELLASVEDNWMGWASAMGPVITGHQDQPEFGAELTESFCRMDPEIALRFARATFTSDNRADLPHVGHPTLVLQCAEDPIAPRSVGEFVHRAIPESTLHILPSSGHCPHLTDPAEVVGAIAAFV